MATFSPVIVTSSRRKDGSFTIFIRVYHRGQTRKLMTSLVARPEDLTRSLRLKNPDLIKKGQDLADKMRSAVSDLSPFALDAMTVDDLVNLIRTRTAGETFRLDFFTFGEGYASGKAPATRASYLGALKALERFLGKRQLDVNSITRTMLQEFVEWNEGQKKAHKSGKVCKTDKIPVGSSARHIAKMRHIYEAAKQRYNDEDAGRIVIPRSPFDGISRTQPPSHGQRALPVEVMRQILTAEPTGTMEDAALAAFALSFLLMGANMADLWRAVPFDGSTWMYNRKKTETRRADRAEMRVDVPAEAATFIARLQDGPKGWWLPALHRLGRSCDACTSLVNRALKAWADRNKVPVFTFYAARHSWATYARRIGVEKATVDECLCHKGDFALTDIYAERAWGLMTEANAKVIRDTYDGIRGDSST